MKKYKKVLKIVLNVLIWVFVVFSLAMTVLALAAQSNSDGVPAIGGKCFLTVSSDSMSPTFEKGDLIFGKMMTTEEKMALKEGDVVTFYADLDGNGSTELNSHRIVGINYKDDGTVDSYVTQGDNTETNVAEDKEPVRWQYVICKWTGKKVANIGGFISFLQKPKGFLILIVLPLILVFLYQLYVFIKTLIDVRNKNKPQESHGISAEEEEAIKQKAIEEYIRQQQLQNKENAPDAPADSVAEQASVGEQSSDTKAE